VAYPFLLCGDQGRGLVETAALFPFFFSFFSYASLLVPILPLLSPPRLLAQLNVEVARFPIVPTFSLFFLPLPLFIRSGHPPKEKKEVLKDSRRRFAVIPFVPPFFSSPPAGESLDSSVPIYLFSPPRVFFSFPFSPPLLPAPGLGAAEPA